VLAAELGRRRAERKFGGQPGGIVL